MGMSAMGKNTAGRETGSLGWAAVIISVDRGLHKEVTAEWRPQGDERGGTGMSGEHVTGRALVPSLAILPPRGHLEISGDTELLWVAST